VHTSPLAFEEMSTQPSDAPVAIDRQDGRILSGPLAAIALSLCSVEAAKERFPGYRLSTLMRQRLELDEQDLALLSAAVGFDVLAEFAGVPRPFNEHLRRVIARHSLDALFCDDGHAPYHHGIRPTGYDFHRDEVDPAGMERWRADYRAMSDGRQMLAASIIWLYRAGKDNVWLRRVPCTWHAADAIAQMKSRDVLPDWLGLFALYPGW
jgi:hypothetical protein